MTAENKAAAKSDQAKGTAKEAAGRITDNERLTDEGRAQQAKGDVREAGEKVKDAFKR
ncbi:CsbD family protein [Streptomyces sp. NPDC060194]|uniref:CsbD family protein n=1 Tax=Streptomyces sp. NPDC060194 TaxID=3347069 RepID=UPI0036667666